MTPSAVRHNKWLTTWFHLLPFKGAYVKAIKIIVSFSLIVYTSMTSKNEDFSRTPFFWLIKSGGVVRSWFRSSYLRFSIFWISTGFLIWWLTPSKLLVSSNFKNIGIIES